MSRVSCYEKFLAKFLVVVLILCVAPLILKPVPGGYADAYAGEDTYEECIAQANDTFNRAMAENNRKFNEGSIGFEEWLANFKAIANQLRREEQYCRRIFITREPKIDPEVQVTKDCVASYTVEVPRESSRVTTLLMDFGDGSSQTRTISQGTGVQSEPFVHEFAPGSFGSFDSAAGSETMSSCGLSSGAVASTETSSTVQTSVPYVEEHRQRATLLETGAFGESITIHYVPAFAFPNSPRIAPEAQVTGLSGHASWTVSVREDPTAPTTLRMAFGDGLQEDRVIPQGSGEAKLEFTHTFDRRGGYLQQATVIESSATGTSATYAGYSDSRDTYPLSERADGATGQVCEREPEITATRNHSFDPSLPEMLC